MDSNDITDNELLLLQLQAEALESSNNNTNTHINNNITETVNNTNNIDTSNIEEAVVLHTIPLDSGGTIDVTEEDLDDEVYIRIHNGNYVHESEVEWCELEEFYEYNIKADFIDYSIRNDLTVYCSGFFISRVYFNTSTEILKEINSLKYIFPSEEVYLRFIKREEEKNKVYTIDDFKHKDIVEETVKMFYPDDYELNTVSYFKITGINTEVYKFALCIKFPIVKIKNSNKINHTIQDLYIFILFNKESELDCNLYGIRESRTKDEIRSNYNHSHLPRDTNYKLNKFCLGSGHIVTNLINCRSTMNELHFGSLLAAIKYYVEWESLEGKPYTSIGDISKEKKLPVVCTTYQTDFLFLLITNINKLNLKIINNKIDVDIDSINNLINNLILDFYIFKKECNTNIKSIFYYIVHKDIDGNYYTINQNSNNNDYLNTLDKFLFVFKGKDIKSKLIDSKEDIKIDYNKAYINQSLVYETKRELVKRINDYYLEKK